MLCSCIVTKLNNTFDSLVCEFTAKAGEGGIVSRCRCNIFTIGNRSTGTLFCCSALSIRKSFNISHLKLVRVTYVAWSYLMCSSFLIRLLRYTNTLSYLNYQVLRSKIGVCIQAPCMSTYASRVMIAISNHKGVAKGQKE